VIRNAHLRAVLDVDVNPNKPYQIATGSRDGVAKFWDLRKTSSPLVALSGHTHW
jgi:WD40 repeat protein